MRNLLECILEKLTINQAREYLIVKRDPRAQAWLDAFWERIKDLPGAEVSKNGHRIYFKFDLPNKDLEMSDQQDRYGGRSNMIKDNIEMLLKNKLGYDIVKFDYIHGKFIHKLKTQRGEKDQELNIGKVLKKHAKNNKNIQELLDSFASDPLRLTSNLNNKKLYIVLSNHAYDIAGMSTDRKWTSCMNLVTGSNTQWIKEDIKWGTVVAYLIELKDNNIENPLGRILIKPYLDDNNAIVYFPEPTIYSPYVGLDSMKEFLQELCNHIANRVSWLYKIARDANDPEQDYEEKTYDMKDFTKEDLKIADEVSKKEWAKLQKEHDNKYKFLLYYDDYFETNKDYIGMRPGSKKEKGKRTI